VAIGKERLKEFDFSLEVKRLADQFVAAAQTSRAVARRRFDLNDLYVH